MKHLQRLLQRGTGKHRWIRSGHGIAAVTLAATLVATVAVWGQSAGSYALTGGVVHTLSGEVIEGGNVVLRDGRIVSVGRGVAIPADAERIDVSGLHVYPGLFDAFSQLGLQEINSLAETNDHLELGEFNPHLAAAAAVHPASERIPVTRAAGITHVIATPSSRPGGIGGSASAMDLDGWTIEEMLIRETVGVVLRWPASAGGGRRRGGFGAAQPFAQAKEAYDNQVEQIRSWLEDARRYRKADEAGQVRRRDLRLEAMLPVIASELPLLVIVDRARDIRDAVAFAEEEGVKIVIVSGRDAPLEAELLAEKDVPVLLRATQNMPTYEDDAYHQTFSGPAVLAESGVRFAITGWASAGPNPPSRTVGQEAANAVKFGLSPEDALKAITLAPAQILGLGEELGSIQPGLRGNLIVTDGDPLQLRTQVLHVFVAGKPASLDNKHKSLYERYRVRSQ